MANKANEWCRDALDQLGSWHSAKHDVLEDSIHCIGQSELVKLN